MKDDKELEKLKALQHVSKVLDVPDRDTHNFNALFIALADRIDYLIQYDFNALLNILYRVDVSEVKLNQALKENKTIPSAQVIAQLLIEREMQKMVFRAQYSKKDSLHN